MKTVADLSERHCAACNEETPPLSAEQIRDYLPAVADWKLSADGKRIRREWKVKDFAAGLAFFTRVGRVAEAENHHPDLHLSDYRQVAIELWTHAIGGLSENDFIVAAKIDQLPLIVKK
jgi:4a-hydroxytetrahydrobiopterin dehydratase